MFDTEFTAATDEQLLAAIEDGVRAEAIAGARRLAAIAELTRRRVDADDDDPRARWVIDPWASAAAEVGAAMAVGTRRASGQMRIAAALRDRLPAVAALYWAGAVSSRVVAEITWSTRLVVDAQALAFIDAAAAERAARWEALSEDKLRQAVEVWVHRYDPDAVRRSHTHARARDFTVGSCDDDAETSAVWGRLLAHDAAVLDARVTAMARGVCAADPRSIGERRSDAVGALGNGLTQLACRCGSPACPAAGTPPTTNVVIRVIADQTALHHATTPDPSTTTDPPTTDQPATDAAAPQPAADAAADAAAPQPAAEAAAPQPVTSPARRVPSPALLLGRGVLPNALLAEAIRAGARIKPIRTPGVEPEPHYRPSAELAEFVRMRDLFCRFPGCEVPADRCDIDHARPWPYGPTHASNCNCKCRPHHLLKTFWTGIGGWTDEQHPDGTVVWTAPSGKTYRTHPGSRLFFPDWDITTAPLPPPTTPPPPTSADRGQKMPRRHRTRAADYIARIQAERTHNQLDTPPF